MVARENDHPLSAQEWPAPAGNPGAVTGPADGHQAAMMTAHDVLRVLDGLHLSGIRAVLAGGWGLDALVGRQSRSHHDLDLLVEDHQVTAALDALAALSYDRIESHGPGRYTARTKDGRAVDIDVVTKEGWQIGPTGRPYCHPPGALDGRGFVVGRPLRCLSAAAQMLSRTAPPEPTETSADLHHRDLQLLAERAGVTMPAPHGTGPHVNYRLATAADLPAMAIVRTAAMADSLAGTVVAEVGVDVAYRYWEQRLAVAGTWIGVMTLGGAVGATLGVAPQPAAPGIEPGTASLFALHLAPSLRDRHLLDPLLQRGLFAANQLGFTDVRIWLPATATADRRFFEQRGWRPDGAFFETPTGMSVARYARRS
jgi:lincosamide nucleotidyltransferase A/C/D/E